jgi:hypothetical protein
MWPFNRSKFVPQSTEPIIEKRRVTMVSANGHMAIDYVPLEYVAAYVRDAQTRWDTVTAGTSHDSGPGGDYAPSVVPEHLHTIKAQIESESE